jgi:hypothetical protein
MSKVFNKEKKRKLTVHELLSCEQRKKFIFPHIE